MLTAGCTPGHAVPARAQTRESMPFWGGQQGIARIVAAGSQTARAARGGSHSSNKISLKGAKPKGPVRFLRFSHQSLELELQAVVPPATFRDRGDGDPVKLPCPESTTSDRSVQPGAVDGSTELGIVRQMRRWLLSVEREARQNGGNDRGRTLRRELERGRDPHDRKVSAPSASPRGGFMYKGEEGRPERSE